MSDRPEAEDEGVEGAAGRRRIGPALGVGAPLAVALACLLIGAIGAGSADRSGSAEGGSPAASATETRAVMHRIFESLIDVLPRVLDDERFARPEEQEKVAKALDGLADAAQSLDQHAQSRDDDFRALGHTLSEDLEEARRRLRGGRPESARFFVVTATQACVSCHSRLPKARDFPMADRLLERIDETSMSVEERALLFVVARSFGRALTTWETALADPALVGHELDLLRNLDDYLVIAVRVERDAARARRTLDALAKRVDLRPSLRALLAHWSEALAQIGDELAAEPTVARARELLDLGPDAEERIWRRDQRIHELVASSLLLRSIDAASSSDPEVAEAFYWLGAIEARSAGSPWGPSAERHLATAIRMAPAAEFAPRALDLLEEYVAFGYGGSGGLHVPAETAALLEELRTLVESAPASTDGAPSSD